MNALRRTTTFETKIFFSCLHMVLKQSMACVNLSFRDVVEGSSAQFIFGPRGNMLTQYHMAQYWEIIICEPISIVSVARYSASQWWYNTSSFVYNQGELCGWRTHNHQYSCMPFPAVSFGRAAKHCLLSPIHFTWNRFNPKIIYHDFDLWFWLPQMTIIFKV